MRLIDADDFKKHYCKENCGENKCVDAMDKCFFIDCLDDFPTAYNVDAVVEELEKLQKEIFKKEIISYAFERNDDFYNGQASGLYKAIEIVKRGSDFNEID